MIHSHIDIVKRQQTRSRREVLVALLKDRFGEQHTKFERGRRVTISQTGGASVEIDFRPDETSSAFILSIESTQRRCGQASILLDAICEVADKADIDLVLDVEPYVVHGLAPGLSDYALIAWYGRRGFVLDHKFKHAYRMVREARASNNGSKHLSEIALSAQPMNGSESKIAYLKPKTNNA